MSAPARVCKASLKHIRYETNKNYSMEKMPTQPMTAGRALPSKQCN